MLHFFSLLFRRQHSKWDVTYLHNVCTLGHPRALLDPVFLELKRLDLPIVVEDLLNSVLEHNYSIFELSPGSIVFEVL